MQYELILSVCFKYAGNTMINNVNLDVDFLHLL